MISSGWQTMVKSAHLISKADKNKCYVKFVFRKVFKKLYKPFHVADFFYSKGTQKEIGHSRGIPRYLDTQGTWSLRYLALEVHLGIQALKTLKALFQQTLLTLNPFLSNRDYRKLALAYFIYSSSLCL